MGAKKAASEKPVMARRSLHRQMADQLREEIREGHLRQGVLLPTTHALAKRWRTSYFTAHTALRALVKEGWLERRVGAGTVVADLSRRFVCAGIFHGEDIFASLGRAYPLSIHFALLRELDLLGKEVRVFIDSRPKAESKTILPSLAEAVNHRQVQVLFILSEKAPCPALHRLPLPTSAIYYVYRNNVMGDETGMFAGALRHLKSQGCGKVGLISTIGPERESFYRAFVEGAGEMGLTTRPEWVRHPDSHAGKQTAYGYRNFRTLWKMRQRPDGLLVWPDEAAQGVIMAALELGVKVPDEMQFVFHRNAGIPVPCPFPALWAVIEERAIARGMIETVQDQIMGLKPKPRRIPYRFEENDTAGYR